jgi:hypothetical protein
MLEGANVITATEQQWKRKENFFSITPLKSFSKQKSST